MLGSAGTNGGNYNAAISTCSPSTSIVNYTNQTETDSAGNTIDVAVPVYKTVNGCADIANISFNQAPDILAKAAFDPGWGHYEVFGIAGFAHETVYPGETTNSNLYGGLSSRHASATMAASAPATVLAAPALTTAGFYNNSIKLGGFGGSVRVPVIKDKLTVGAKALYGPGVGRYGDSTLADVTANALGQLGPIHNLSGLLTVEATPTARSDPLPELRRRLCRPRRTTPRQPPPRWAQRLSHLLPHRHRGIRPHLAAPLPPRQPTWQPQAAAWGATLEGSLRSCRRLRFAAAFSNSGCTSITAPGYNGGSSTGYYRRRLLRRANPRRAGDHRRLLV